MTLQQKQSVFSINIAKLIIFANENGIDVTFGEAWRTSEQQLLFFEGYSVSKIGSNLHFVKAERKTKKLNSKHLSRLAIDLNIFVNGIWKTKKEDYKILAEYWKELNTANDCGYFWDWDFNHFEMR